MRYGCSQTVDARIVIDVDKEIFVPNVFSPNGDGTNDLFRPFANSEDLYRAFLHNFRSLGRNHV